MRGVSSSVVAMESDVEALLIALTSSETAAASETDPSDEDLQRLRKQRQGDAGDSAVRYSVNLVPSTFLPSFLPFLRRKSYWLYFQLCYLALSFTRPTRERAYSDPH